MVPGGGGPATYRGTGIYKLLKDYLNIEFLWKMGEHQYHFPKPNTYRFPAPSESGRKIKARTPHAEADREFNIKYFPRDVSGRKWDAPHTQRRVPKGELASISERAGAKLPPTPGRPAKHMLARRIWENEKEYLPEGGWQHRRENNPAAAGPQ